MLHDRECIICNDVEEYEYNELTLVKCKNCDLFFHRICYGIPSSFSQGIVILCDPCQYDLQMRGKQLNKLSSSKDLKCSICFNGGVLKRALIPMKFSLFQDNSSINIQNKAIWVHIDCAIYSYEYICINNWRNMSNIEILKPLKYMNTNSCILCHGNLGLLKKCNYNNCEEKFHVHCLLKTQEYCRKNIKINRNYEPEVYCLKHLKKEHQIHMDSNIKKSIINSLRNEISIFEESCNLNNYILNILRLNNNELLTYPEYLLNRNFDGFSLLSIIVTSDIWTIRSTALLSLVTQKQYVDKVLLTEKSKILKWIKLSKYIPINPKYRDNLLSIYEQVVFLIGYKDKNIKSKINNNVLYHIKDIQALIGYENIMEWESKYSEYLKILNDNKKIINLDIQIINSIIDDCPVRRDQCEDKNFNFRILYKSKLYLSILKLENKIRRLIFELKKTINLEVINIDKIKYLINKFNNEVPKNTPFDKSRYLKMIKYSRLIENKLVAIFNSFINRNEDSLIFEDQEVGIYELFLSETSSLQNNIIDWMLNKNNLNFRDLKTGYEDFSKNCIINVKSSFNSDNVEYKDNNLFIINKRFKSKSMKSIFRNILRYESWEKEVCSCFNIIKNLKEKYGNNGNILIGKELSFEEKYRLFHEYIHFRNQENSSLFKQISFIQNLYYKNKYIFSKSRINNKYNFIIKEYQRVLSLEHFLNQPELNINAIDLFIDSVLKNKFYILPLKSTLSNFFERIGDFIKLMRYTKSCLLNEEFSIDMVIFLNHYLKFNKEVDSYSLDISNFEREFNLLMNQIIEKFIKHFNIISKIFSIINNLDNADDLMIQKKDDQQILNILSFLNEKYKNKQIKGFIDVFIDYLTILKNIKKFKTKENLNINKSIFFENHYYKNLLNLLTLTDLKNFAEEMLPEQNYLTKCTDCNFKIRLNVNWKIKIIQRVYVVLISDYLKELNQKLNILSFKKEIESLYLMKLLFIWRKLRLLNYENIFKHKRIFKNILEDDFEHENDISYNQLMNFLTQKLIHYFNSTLEEGKLIPGFVDEYYNDLRYMLDCKSEFGPTFFNLLNSELEKLEKLNENIDSILVEMNVNSYESKKFIFVQLISKFIYIEPVINKDKSSFYKNEFFLNIHQPISFNEQIKYNLLEDFPTKTKNDFYYEIPINCLFLKDVINNIKSKYNIFKYIFFCNNDIFEDKNNFIIENPLKLFNKYLDILESERNKILMILVDYKKIKINNLKNYEEICKNDDFLIGKLLDIYKEDNIIFDKIKFLNIIVNEYIHLEISFILTLLKFNYNEIQLDNIEIKEWFDRSYINNIIPFDNFKYIIDRFESKSKNQTHSLNIYQIIFQISEIYINFVFNWNCKFYKIIEAKSNMLRHDYYQILLLYNQNQLIERLFEYTNVSNPLNNYIFYYKRYKKIKEIFREFNYNFVVLLDIFKDYINNAFSNILKNGLYNYNSSSKFLTYFPHQIINILRNYDVKYTQNSLDIINIEDLSLVYFSKDLFILVAKIFFDGKYEFLYLDPQILITLSNEIEINAIINSKYFKKLIDQFDIFYASVGDFYFYVTELDAIDLNKINSEIVKFESLLMEQITSPKEINISLVKSEFLSLNQFYITKQGKGKSLKNKFIVISDILEIINHMLFYRINVHNLFGKNYSKNFDDHPLITCDKIKKLLLMYYSLDHLTENLLFSKFKRKNDNLKIFPDEFFNLLKELSTLYLFLNEITFPNKEKKVSFKNKPIIRHHLFERELMLMEDFYNWEVISNLYLFQEIDLNELIFTSLIWIPEYENFNTTLDIIELITFHIESIHSFAVEYDHLQLITEFKQKLNIHKEKILNFEEKALKLLKEIVNEERERVNQQELGLNNKLLDATLFPSKVRQKYLKDIISYDLLLILPNYNFLNRTLNIIPFKGFEMLTSYYNNSLINDKNILNTMRRINSEMEKFKSKELVDIMNYNLKYLNDILYLRQIISNSNIWSELIFRAYVEFFNGIVRYYLIYGTKSQWGNIFDDDNKVTFVPIIAYSTIKKLYKESILWNNSIEKEDNINDLSKYCEFVILECLLSYSNYIIENISYKNFSKDDYLIKYNMLNYLYTEHLSSKDKRIMTSFIGIVDIGEYLIDYSDLINKELIIKSEIGINAINDSNNVKFTQVEIGNSNIYGKLDNKLIHRFSRKNKIKVRFCEVKNSDDHFINNIHLLTKNLDNIVFKWSIVPISYSLKPINCIYYLRNYVKQYLEFIFAIFYNKEDSEYIKKKDHALYLESFNEKEKLTINNMFTIINKYLKGVVDYSFKLLIKSMNLKSYEYHLSYSNLSNYPKFIEFLNNKWLICDVFISKNKFEDNLNIEFNNNKRIRKNSEDLNKTKVINDKQNINNFTNKNQNTLIQIQFPKEKSTKEKFLDEKQLLDLEEYQETQTEINEKNNKLVSETKIIQLNEERLNHHEGINNELKFTWLGWLNFNDSSEKELIPVGFYQISNQFVKESDKILKELNLNLDFVYNGKIYSIENIELNINNSMFVLISSNWSENLKHCNNEIFNKIFHYQYNMDNYEIFEFDLLNCENNVKLWILPCNLDRNESNQLFNNRNKLLLPISKYYLLGIVILNVETEKQKDINEMSTIVNLLPNESQLYNIAEYCHNKSLSSKSKMEFLTNKNMFSSAGTLLSSLLSVNNQSGPILVNNDNSSNITTLRELANTLKRKISET